MQGYQAVEAVCQHLHPIVVSFIGLRAVKFGWDPDLNRLKHHLIEYSLAVEVLSFPLIPAIRRVIE